VPEVFVLGVRHHGPGCARSVRRELARLAPDCVLVEGPPEGDGVLPLMAKDGMKPPVSLLVYAPDRPKQAVFYPFTDFSPEWQGLLWAAENEVPARFIDLPVAYGFREVRDAEEVEATEGEDGDAEAEDAEGEAAGAEEAAPATPDAPDPIEAVVDPAPVDPIGALATAAGYDDPEEWWDQQVERRDDDTDLFVAILEAMSAVREARPDADTPHRRREDRREAHMRREIRRAKNAGHERIAVICGAWHAPVLTWDFIKRSGRATADNALLKGLKKTRVSATWVPWTNARLAFRSGYGAGVTSPGWYRLLWEHPTQASARWLAQSAALLRSAGIDVSSAHVIEGVRLADALAALRGLPRPGLEELKEATTTVLLGGYPDALALVRDALEVGDVLGGVPPETPTVPLQADFERQRKSARLKQEVEPRELQLDLRQDPHRRKSVLLWRLRALGIPWGEPVADLSSNRQGTFWEHWRLAWEPEFEVGLIEANTLGNTVEVAAAQGIAERAVDVDDLAGLIDLLDAAILADLPTARRALLEQLAARAALSPDVHRLVAALPPLARIARYGDVRGTASEEVMPILDGLFERTWIGLPPACIGLDEEAASTLGEGVAEIQRILVLLERASDPGWADVLLTLSTTERTAPHLQGTASRLRLDRRELEDDELRRLVGRALSLGNPPGDCAAWLEGFLRGGGAAILHREAFWGAFDTWLRGLPDELFADLLPALRRGFSAFSPGDRRKVAERVASLRVTADGTVVPPITSRTRTLDLAPHRVALALPALAHLLGTTEALPTALEALDGE